MKRRLAAILAADVVGYSRLIRADEEGTLAALKSLRTNLIDPKLREYNGRTVKLMGDGVLVEFASAVDAVSAAAEIQEAVASHNVAAPPGERIEFRVGINLGDVVIDDEDIHGDGVNVATRLEGLSDPGGMCISAAVHDQVRDRVDLVFEDMGEQTVKNINRPVRTWRWLPKSSAKSVGGSAGGKPLPVIDKPSVAVLPFTNMSGDPDQEYFADGITEDIITELSRFQSIFVIARNSVFTYKGRAVRVQDVGNDLGVRYVVEGSVRKAGDRVRVTVQLIEAQSGNHIWAERYDRELSDIFELQDELTRSIVATLPGRVESADVERIRRKPFHDISAYDCVLRAKLNHHRGTREDNAEGLKLLDQAIEKDPECASAYAWRACIIAQAGARGYIDYTEELNRQLYRQTLKGLSLDENDLECVRILGEFRIEQRRLDDALVQNDRALRINPNDPRVVAQRGEILTWQGLPEDGISWVLKAMRLDPYDADAWAHLLGRALFGAREYLEAVSAFKRVAMPRYPHHAFMAVCHNYLGDIDSAEADRDELLRLKPDFRCGEFCKTLFYANDADCRHVCDGLSALGLPE